MLRDFSAAKVVKERTYLEQHLFQFVKAAWPLVEPQQPFTPNWHIEALCQVLEQVAYGREKRLIVNVPPGTLKSLLIEVFFPTWVWAKNARKRFITASYGQHLTARDNLRARQIIESPWYQARWPVRMLEDQNTKTRYNTTEHGWRIATSVNGQGIGEHPDFIIIDDPHTAAQAESETERQNALDWFDRTISTRLGRNPAIIVVMQRLHENDLSGHLLKRGGWRHICWPMRYEVTRPAVEGDLGHRADPLDPRHDEGELLFPALFPEEKVRNLEIDLGEYGAAGQLQQRPAPEGGGMFKRGWFKFLDAAPKNMSRRVRGWDTAGSEGKGDYTVGCKIMETMDGLVIVEDIVRDQLAPAGVDALVLSTSNTDGRRCPVREEKEGGAAGKSVIAARAKLLRGFDYKEVILGQNKVVRAKPFRSQCEAGNVYLIRGVWNEPFIAELCGFPTGNHDDQMDAASCAYNAMLLEPKKRKYSSSW